MLVHWCYEENQKYLEGSPCASSLSKNSSLMLLHRFLNSDLSGLAKDRNGVDHRQRGIELLSRVEVSLTEHLLWIGYPDFRTDEIFKALRSCVGRRIPQIELYSFKRNFNPDALAAHLEMRAYEQVISRYAR
jgi:hypothetical protein